jgi:hypothetical protein
VCMPRLSDRHADVGTSDQFVKFEEIVKVDDGGKSGMVPEDPCMWTSDLVTGDDDDDDGGKSGLVPGDQYMGRRGVVCGAWTDQVNMTRPKDWNVDGGTSDHSVSFVEEADVYGGKIEQRSMPGVPGLTGSHVYGRTGDQMVKSVKVDGGKCQS